MYHKVLSYYFNIFVFVWVFVESIRFVFVIESKILTRFDKEQSLSVAGKFITFFKYETARYDDGEVAEKYHSAERVRDGLVRIQLLPLLGFVRFVQVEQIPLGHCTIVETGGVST